MFNKKRIKNLGNEITAMKIDNATIQMMYKSFESEIQKIKESFTKLDLRVDIIKRLINTMEARNLEERIEKTEKENERLREESKQTVNLVKELLEKLGYEYEMVRNEDYMTAYKVELTEKEKK